MIKIAVVEDDDKTAADLAEMLGKFGEEQGVAIRVTRYAKGADFIAHYRQQFDIVLMDIELPDSNGMELAAQMRRGDPYTIIIFVTNLAPAFTLAAQDVYAMTQDAAVKIPDGFDYAASLDFASSPFAWIIYHLVISIKYVGPAALVLFTGFMVWVNHRRIVKLNQENNNEINKQI